MANIERFKDAVNYWQQAYGLAEWQLHVEEQDGDKATEVTVDLPYLRAIIRVQPSLDDADIEHAACHEVAHVFLGEFVNHSANIREWFTGGHRNALDEAWHLAWERTTERLARLMEDRKA